MLHRTIASATIVLALSTLASTDAVATAQRTFVASYGLATNTAFNCSIAKPCRAFSEATGVTNTAGEVIVMDSAGYGPATITQSVSIIAPPGVYAGISVFTGSGIVIDGAAVTVHLRGLTINGQGGALNDGIGFFNGAALVVEDCEVANMTTGIDASAPGSTVSVKNTSLHDNGSEGFKANGSVVATLDGVTTQRNQTGLLAYNGSQVSVSNSVLAYNAIAGARRVPSMHQITVAHPY